jgi:hypothetical protein
LEDCYAGEEINKEPFKITLKQKNNDKVKKFKCYDERALRFMRKMLD